MRILFSSIALLLLFSVTLTPTLVDAAEQVNIYTVEIPVKTQSPFFRKLAMREGLGEVLVRASGRDDSLRNEYIISNLPKAHAFVQQFAYVKPNKVSADFPWLLRMNFDEAVIQRLLADAGLPQWSETRPVVLLWLAEKDGTGRRIVETGSDSSTAVFAEAARRAIPLQLPAMDAEDKRRIDFTDIWGKFASPVKAASQRYNADIIVFGRIYPQNGQWISDWQMLLENERSGWRSQAKTRDQANQQLLSEIGRRLCDKYCVIATNLADNQLYLRVSDLDNLIAAASAEKYLLSLLPVRDINLVELNGNQALFKLRLVSREQAVLEAIALDSALSPLPNAQFSGLEQRIYNYRWTP